jgi:hypothetical protein
MNIIPVLLFNGATKNISMGQMKSIQLGGFKNV